MSKKIITPKERKTNKTAKQDVNSKTLDLNTILINDFSEEEYKIEKGELSLDILEDNKNIFIESPVAGVDVDNINIDVEPEKIKIEGIRKREKIEKSKKYIHRECFYGSFSRSIILPSEIVPEKTSAKIENGILKIVLLKIKK